MPHIVTAPHAVPSPIALLRRDDIARPDRAVIRGELIVVRRGVYAHAPEWLALAPWEKYLARVHAVAAQLPDVPFCLESASALTGMPVLGDPLVVHVLGDTTTTSRLISGIRTHTASVPREICDLGGVLTTTPAETAVDIARTRHRAVGLAAADASLRLDPSLSVEALVAVNESRASSRGRRQARWALHRARAEAETTLESVSRAVIEWLGFPEPELQECFTSSAGERDRPDFWWPGARIAGEADGDLKYDGRYGEPLALLRDRRSRDARLRERARAVAHWAWPEVIDFPQLRGILGIHLPRISGEDTAHLLALRRLLWGHKRTSYDHATSSTP